MQVLKVTYSTGINRPRFTPADTYTRKLADLMHKKAFSAANIDKLKELFDIEVVPAIIEVPEKYRGNHG